MTAITSINASITARSIILCLIVVHVSGTSCVFQEERHSSAHWRPFRTKLRTFFFRSVFCCSRAGKYRVVSVTSAATQTTPGLFQWPASGARTPYSLRAGVRTARQTPPVVDLAISPDIFQNHWRSPPLPAFVAAVASAHPHSLTLSLSLDNARSFSCMPNVSYYTVSISQRFRQVLFLWSYIRLVDTQMDPY